jgi:hypothetical protein
MMNYTGEATTNTGIDGSQPQFGNGYHDSIQYHFFCEDRFFSARIFNTKHFTHHSAWVFDGAPRELVNSSEPLQRIGTDRLNVHASRFVMDASNGGGTIAVHEDGTSGPILEMRFKVPRTFTWYCLEGPAIHQTHIQGEITYQGKRYTGLGYCKRYWWDENIEYWGYRFVQSVTSSGTDMIWTADATFAQTKYAYFKESHPDGSLGVAEEKDSAHRNDVAYGVIDGIPYEIRLKEMGSWETCLKSETMDSKMRQRFCKATIRRGDRQDTGYALNETCFGTIR